MPHLRGPADADHYRVKVGRYGDRWYTDPLPGCDIAPASDREHPSWSIVKGAAGKDWSFVANKRNATASAVELHRIADLEPPERARAFNAIDRAGLDQAAGRGTIIHLWAEDLLAGRSPREITALDLKAMRLPRAALDEALLYRDALVAFFDTYQPTLKAAEYPAFHRTLNGHGYGCTPDVTLDIGGELFGVDWKSRSIDSDHGAYPEEAAQIAAGARAEYIIVVGEDGQPMRVAPPMIDTGLVVSIKPDGCRVYPVDIDAAWQHTQAMHAFWVARLDERKPIGKAWAPQAAPVKEPANRDNLRARIAELIEQGHEDVVRKLWPQGVPPLSQDGHTADQLDAVLAAVRKAETEVGAQFHDDDMASTPAPKPEPNPRPVVEVQPDDSEMAADVQVAAIATAFGALGPDHLDSIKAIAGEANAAGRSISVAQVPSVRRCRIARALIGWATSGQDADALFAAAALIATDAQTADGEQTLGALIGSFDAEQAERLADTFSAATAAA